MPLWILFYLSLNTHTYISVGSLPRSENIGYTLIFYDCVKQFSKVVCVLFKKKKENILQLYGYEDILLCYLLEALLFHH